MDAARTALSARLATELPYLRRYARAIAGSQVLGDQAVREMLEAAVADPHQFDAEEASRLSLYRLLRAARSGNSAAAISHAEGAIGSLPVTAREALLLTMVEGFSTAETAKILDIPGAEVERMIEAARTQVERELRGTVMIIEDESVIAMHLQKIARSLGNTIAGVARTHREAVALAHETHPDLILADISLADGSSGIDAVKDILDEFSVPVIFITAFPQRLLTGERPEPTYLITKPFEPETVTATMWQALLVHREARAGPQAA